MNTRFKDGPIGKHKGLNTICEERDARSAYWKENVLSVRTELTNQLMGPQICILCSENVI